MTKQSVDWLGERTMKTYLSVLVIAFTLTFGIYPAVWAQSTPLRSPNSEIKAAQTGPVVNGLALSASTDKKTYVGGEAIVLKIALKNPTTTYQFQGVVGSSAVFDLYDFDVNFADEGEVPFTAFGKSMLKRKLTLFFDPSPVYSLIVPPGKSLDYQVVINRLFDMSRSRTYWITVRWHDAFADVASQQHSHKRMPVLVSNQVVLRVEDPAPDFYGDSNVFGR